MKSSNCPYKNHYNSKRDGKGYLNPKRQYFHPQEFAQNNHIQPAYRTEQVSNDQINIGKPHCLTQNQVKIQCQVVRFNTKSISKPSSLSAKSI